MSTAAETARLEPAAAGRTGGAWRVAAVVPGYNRREDLEKLFRGQTLLGGAQGVLQTLLFVQIAGFGVAPQRLKLTGQPASACRLKVAISSTWAAERGTPPSGTGSTCSCG